MPHKDMSHWQSIYRNQPVEHVSARTVEELTARGERARREPMEHLFRDLPKVGELHEHVVLRAEGDTPTAEIYTPPSGEGPFPVFLHIHGGGWFTGSARQERRFCMRFAAAGFVVVNLEYALAPSDPFPRGLEDCVYAARWIVREIERFGGDPSRVAVGGGSAGGNLSALTALALHGSDEGLDGGDLARTQVRFSAVLLLFGVLDVHHWIAEPHYYAGDSEIMVQAYLGPNFTGRLRDPLVSPIHNPHLAALPPTYLSCGAEDAFLSHSLRMTERLAQADVPVTLSVVEGADHEFHKVPESVPGAAEENARIIDWLGRHV